jgi:hypothetical protein
LLAIAAQTVLPFLLAFCLAVSAPPRGFSVGVPICSAGPPHKLEGSIGDPFGGHQPAGGLCPICHAFGLAQAFPAAPADDVAVPRPPPPAIDRVPSPKARPVTVAAAAYRSRAPPSHV